MMLESNQQDINRAIGSLVGLACGDAVGTTLEFMSRGSFTPITDMLGGGPFKLLPGQWTDDTSMALCLAESLLYRNGFDPIDQINRYCNWYQHGYLSCTGECFDIGMTVSAALNQYLKTGNPYSGSVDERSSGNGSLMRISPIAIFCRYKPHELVQYAADSSRITHGSAECIDACQYFCQLLVHAFVAKDKRQLINIQYSATTANIKSIANGDFLNKSYAQIKGSGYVIESLEAALWCFYQTSSFEDAILSSANLGDDADTTAAICGQIAGAYYGVDSIPENWLKKLAWGDYIVDVAHKLYEKSQG
jgi:ADP-ribosyl-[dinitrogen reductase] hydrolase